MAKFLFSLSLMAGLLVGNIGCADIGDIEAAVMDKDYVAVKELATTVLKSTADKTKRIEAEYYLGLAQLRLGQYAQARKAFQMVMEATSDKDFYDKAAVGMLEGLVLAGFYKDALKEGERLLKRSPNSPFLSVVYLKMARTNLKMMQWSKANEYLNKILTEFPDSLEAPLAKQLMEEKEYFTVQVGSFTDKGRAVALSNELKISGHYAYIVEMLSPEGSKFYRVRVGQMTSLPDAKNLEKRLAQLGYPTLIYP